jgi:hypothetical protein
LVSLVIDLERRRVLGVEALPDASVDRYVLPSDFHYTLPSQPEGDEKNVRTVTGMQALGGVRLAEPPISLRSC